MAVEMPVAEAVVLVLVDAARAEEGVVAVSAGGIVTAGVVVVEQATVAVAIALVTITKSAVSQAEEESTEILEGMRSTR